jgi:four helix bundle protein
MKLSDLQIWTRSVDLAEKIHIVTKNFPKEERYGLTSQMRGSSTSIPSNIAEGSQRTTNKDCANFILIAKGSLAELQTQVLLSKRFGYITEVVWQELSKEIDELHRMLYAFHSKLITHNS